MTTFLVLLLIVSPVTGIVMVINQHSLNKIINSISGTLKDIKSTTDSTNDRISKLKKDKDVKMSSIEFNNED